MSSTNQSFQRPNPDGFRLQFGGMNTVNPPDQMPPNKYPYAQNVRSYVRQRVGPRAAQDAAVEVVAGSVHSIRRLNDTTPNGPASGYVLLTGAGTDLYISSRSAPLVPLMEMVGPRAANPWSVSVTAINFGTIATNTVVGVTFTLTFTDPTNQYPIAQWVSLLIANVGSAGFYEYSQWNSQMPLPGSNYDITIAAFQTQPGTYTATMTLGFTDSGIQTQISIPISATVQGPAGVNIWSVSVSSINFGTIATNTVAGFTFTLTFTDPTNQYPTAQWVGMRIANVGSAGFSANPDWTAQMPLPGANYTVGIEAYQTQPGTYTATLTLLFGGGGSPTQIQIPITAIVQGAAGVDVWSTSVSSIHFGTIPANQVSSVQFTLNFNDPTNRFPTAEWVGMIMANVGTANFAVSPDWNSQMPLPGSNYNIIVSMNQSQAGNYTATLTLTFAGGGTPTQIQIPITATVQAGTGGGAASVSVSPTALNFGSQTVGIPTAPQIAVISNNSSATVSLSSPAMSNAEFYLQNPPAFPYNLPAGSVLVLNLGATPSVLGLSSGTFTINTNASGVAQLSVSLAVAGTAPGGGGGTGKFSGNPLSMIPFRPNASPQPWMYVGDSVAMEKVRSDGTIYRVGIQEPQVAPQTQIIPASDVLSTVGPITVTYWGDSPHSGPVGNYIWKHASDTRAYGPVRATTPASGATTGNSLIFDVPAFAGIPLPSGFAAPGSPMLWFQYDTYNGIVTTGVDSNGPFAEWDSGDQFGGLVAGDAIIIGGVSFVIAASPTPNNTRVYLTTSAGTQQNINYSAAIVGGGANLFVPPLESEGYSDFNFSLSGTFYVPAAGSYTFYWQSKDESLFGIGNSGIGTATWSPASAYPGAQLSLEGQSVTSINGYPLMPKTVVYDNAGQYNHGGAYTGSGLDNGYSGVTVNFSQPGNYPFEINFDYWYHSGRILHVEVVGPTQAQGPNPLDIPPLPLDVITNASYRYTYRSSATGATSNPSPESPQQNFSVLSTNVIPTPSGDPQVDKIDIYRMDSGLLNFTYVGTIANDPAHPAVFDDKLLDTDVSGNPVLQFDNFEPFPSIDLPRLGTANVLAGGVIQATGGDAFNVRWLPGTIIVVHTTAFTLNTRPTSASQLTCSNVDVVQGVEQVVYPDPATGVAWAIQEPILAAQRLPYLWGPTDNVSFFFACGDPLRPGTLYWSKGNQPDSAPDTNQQDVTSPSEPLMNGCITNGLGMVFSTERAWIIIPNFFNAQATVEGNIGSTWTLQETISNRGLYMPWCLAVDGGGNVYFRAKDGIYVSPSGQGSQSITDPDLFNIFPHEGVDRKLTPITIGVAPNAYTVYPPDDSQPAFQNLHFANGYLYYDYRDASHTPRTLVFDVAAGGWVVDVYQNPVRTHVLEEGIVNGTLVGTEGGLVQPLTGTGAEAATAVLLMPSFDAGDVRANKQWGDLYVEAETGSVK